MLEKELKKLLEKVKKGSVSVEEALQRLKHLPYERLGEVVFDTHRTLRTGFPEIIYGEGKTRDMLKKLIRASLRHSSAVLVTRVKPEDARTLTKSFKRLFYSAEARALHTTLPKPKTEKHVSVITAGASDIPVGREAELTCRMMGVPVKFISDVGIAGIHRIAEHLKDISSSACAVVVAGMEGALPGVIAGMVGIPVIGVPSSVGYGTAEGGFTALFSMLSSCAPNLVTVNINDGVGAGFTASLIALGQK